MQILDTVRPDAELRRCPCCGDQHLENDFDGSLCGWCRDEMEVAVQQQAIEVAITEGPDGRPSVVLNINGEYHLGFYDPDELEAAGDTLHEFAENLRDLIRQRNAALS